MDSAPIPSQQRALWWICAIALAGLALRVAAARGSLWTDEAWSAVFANQVGTVVGVFRDINHDNNHHLNSLWLLTVGIGAPPLLARALSIAAGSAAIVVAGLIGLRRGPAAGLVTAFLFALSPVLVTLGSEARGYAPMLFFLLVCFRQVDRALDGDASAERPLRLALCFYIGTLFQLTLVFGACAIIGWYGLTLWRRDGLRRALARSLRLFGPSLAALGAAVLLIFGPALRGVAFTFGDYVPFSLPMLGEGIRILVSYSLGVPWSVLYVPVTAGAAIVALFAWRLAPRRAVFYWLAIFAFPLVFAALQPLNPVHPRYYLLIGVALLLLLGEAIAGLIRAGGWKRVAGSALLAIFAAGSAWANLDLIETRRGDTSPAIHALAARAPVGATVLIERPNGTAILRVAAAEQHYALRYTTACPAQPFLFLDRFTGEAQSQPTEIRCGAAYRAIAAGISRGLSGQNWTLYERVD